MTKIRTKRSAAKRFSFTGTGKIKRNRAYHRHMMTGKPTAAKREHRKSALVADADVALVRRMLPYGG
ncbi:MAG TPA: 50S ribosomal protein L35 [Geminicoccaceae bacterium]|nr:50S ribosomal protein L35 [Geminicoccaceae bacterium]